MSCPRFDVLTKKSLLTGILVVFAFVNYGKMLLAEGLSSVDGIGLSDHPIFVNRKVNVENCINQALFSGKDQAIFSNLYGLMALCIAVMSDELCDNGENNLHSFWC